jgi:hypothetical protein
MKLNLATEFLGILAPVEITAKEFIDQCRTECAPAAKPGKKRQDALNRIRYSGYHNDVRTMLEIRLRHRISHEAAMESFAAGARAKRNGIPCGCYQCRKERGEV